MCILKCARWLAIVSVICVVFCCYETEARNDLKKVIVQGRQHSKPQGRVRRNNFLNINIKKCPRHKRSVCRLMRILVQCQRIYCKVQRGCSQVYRMNSKGQRKCVFCRKNVCLNRKNMHLT